ncbi:MAG: diguanylate cyclase [Marinicella sp.]
MFKPSNRKGIVLTVLLGVLAAVINYFRLPLFFEAEFIFGQALVLLVAVFRGPLMGVLSAVIASSVLAWLWGSLWIVITLSLEALFVAFVCRKNRFNLILAVVAYWFFIGMPLSWISISNYEQFINSHKITILVKQLTNAIIYANIAAVLMLVPQVKNLLGSSNIKETISLKNKSAHFISTLLISVGVLFFFFTLNQNIKNSSEKAIHTHNLKHQELYHQVSLLIKSNVESLNEFSYLLSEIWEDEKRGSALSHFNSRHPVFGTMLIADINGDVTNVSAPALNQEMFTQQTSLNVADRDYFNKVTNNDEIYVSTGFTGRGLGSDLIVAISKSIPGRGSKDTNYLGIVEGTIILESLEPANHAFNNITYGVDAILIDQNNQVLMASDNLALEPLEKINYQKNTQVLKSEGLVNLVINDEVKELEFYYPTVTTFQWGWKLITLQDESVFVKMIEKSLMYFAVSILLVIFISYILAKSISYSWSYYLHKLNLSIKHGVTFDEGVSEFEDNDQLPEEVKNFYQEIKSSRQQILKMNQDLQNTIAERTEKLQKANDQLNIVARLDELTGLENRRVFNDCMNELWIECQRELAPFSMIIIDIDHFKKLNDSYGHPVGDRVLMFLGKELTQFKSTDVKCLARIGGEEFCMLIKTCSHQFVKDFAEQIRTHIESLQIQIGEGKVIKVTISCGVATIDATKYTSSRLYQLADNALYEAKHSGRNQTKAYEET